MLKNVTNLNKKNFSIDSILLTNLVLAFFPISFILGNFIINLNLILFCVLGIVHLKSKILTIKFNFPIKIIFLLFFIIFFSTSLSFTKSLYFEGYEYINLERLIKSILFFRYFLMLVIIYLLNEHNILNLKYFFISAAFSTLIVSLDVIYQYIFGVNIIGLISHGHHNSGFFGDELIAGGFIQNFSFFLILFVTLILKNKNYLRFILTTIIVCILGISIMLSVNKTPLILFLFGLLLVFLFNNKLRKIIPVSLICLFILFKFIFSFDATMKSNYESIYDNILGTVNLFTHTLKRLGIEVRYADGTQIVEPISENDSEKNYEAQDSSTIVTKKDQPLSLQRKKLSFLSDRTYHGRLLLTALDTWKQNKIFGNGIKSFRLDCFKLQGIISVVPSHEYNLAEHFSKYKKNRLCSNHPHNYYFEILTETGIVGLFITLMIASLFVVFILKNFRFFKGNNIENFILLAATISLILEVFPFKTSGSVFTTNNAAYIILIASIILSHKKRQIVSKRTTNAKKF